MEWKDKIATGLNLIIEGCKDNPSWNKCHECPFDDLCSAIYLSDAITVSTPDCYVEEGYFDNK